MQTLSPQIFPHDVNVIEAQLGTVGLFYFLCTTKRLSSLSYVYHFFCMFVCSGSQNFVLVGLSDPVFPSDILLDQYFLFPLL